MGRPRKKYVLFLVEGRTDKEVLEYPISSIYEEVSSPDSPVEVEFCIFNQNDNAGGDITSSIGVNPDNIEGLIGKLFIDPFLDKNPFIYPKEISEIIHIVDLDGTFIPSDKVAESSDSEKLDKPIYSESKILTGDVDSILARNERKSANIRKLVSMDKIVIRHNNGRNKKTVNYSIYYFSCNMDHVVHKKLNLSPQEKYSLAEDFSVACSFSLDTFKMAICEDKAACREMTYQESWKCVMNDGESLKRHTNLNLLIDKLYGNV